MYVGRITFDEIVENNRVIVDAITRFFFGKKAKTYGLTTYQQAKWRIRVQAKPRFYS